jgi:putative DNA primase/helicase
MPHSSERPPPGEGGPLELSLADGLGHSEIIRKTAPSQAEILRKSLGAREIGMIDFDTITRAARAVRIEYELARRNIRLPGKANERCGPCPVCGGNDRFSINTKKNVWNCRRCPAGGDVIELVRHLDGLSFAEAVRLLAGAQLQRSDCSIRKQPAQAATQPSDNAARALNIWWPSIHPWGTLVEKYLKHRELELTDEAAFDVIRFHPDCPFGPDERFPAMICLVRNIVTNEPQGIHRTALMPDGTAIKRGGKTFRMSLGPVAGGAIKLDPDENIEQGLCIGEGVETCLAGRLIGYRPVWSVVSKSGVDRFPLLPGIDGLTIFGEYDENQQSMEAIQSCAERWLAAGKEVLTAWPMAGNDLNDELRRQHVH